MEFASEDAAEFQPENLPSSLLRRVDVRARVHTYCSRAVYAVS